MKERPILLFPKHEAGVKAKRQGGPSNFKFPSYGVQRDRLAPQLKALQDALNAGLTLQTTADGTEPEYTLVLEVVGSCDNFFTAIKTFQKDKFEIEWLYELATELNNDENFYAIDNKGDKKDNNISGKLFCIMTNRTALQQMLTLWDNYSTNENYKFKTGYTGLRDVFKNLRSIHQWGIQERLYDTGVLESWSEDLTDTQLPAVKCELELAYKRDRQAANRVEEVITNIVSECGGRLITKARIEEIRYHTLLVEIPRRYAQRIIDLEEVSLVLQGSILFIRAAGQSRIIGNVESVDMQLSPNQTTIVDEPIVALFDGLPQQNHPDLQNLLIVDDDDDFASTYRKVSQMQHGTSMASLILRGEYPFSKADYLRKIYVRPIMKPEPMSDDGYTEFVPEDVLIVDLIHRAVKRLFDSVGSTKAAAPSIKVINLSIGLDNRVFEREISPLAKLLDWLSVKYKVLFIVSAGNHGEDFDLEMSIADFKTLSQEKKDQHIIKIMEKGMGSHRLLSPAESMNSLTIGAQFSDKSVVGTIPSHATIPVSTIMPSPYSAVGSGINRSIKPDILFDGGRALLTQRPNSTMASWSKCGKNSAPGILSASPKDVAAGTSSASYNYGTSDATALVSHNAVICYDALAEVFQNENNGDVPQDHIALLLKSMLVHGATWNSAMDTIANTLGYEGRGGDKVHKWLGYGMPDISRVIECTKNRITLIAFGDLSKDESHAFYIPLPFDFHIIRIKRKLTVTLSTFANIIPSVQKYREAIVWFSVEDEKNIFQLRQNVDAKSAIRGTLQHEIFEEERIVPFDKDGGIKIRVSCAEAGGKISQKIPYALFVTLEIAPEIGADVDVYALVMDAIRIKEPVQLRNID